MSPHTGRFGTRKRHLRKKMTFGAPSGQDAAGEPKIVALKRALQAALQRALGLPAYLDLFARYRLVASRFDARDAPFRAFLRRLPRDGVVLDVGANVGVLAVLLARHVRSGRVHAFEPNPFARSAAQRLAARSGARNVVFHDCALGSTNGQAELVMPERDHVFLHGLSRVVSAEDPAAAAAGSRFVVPRRALDGLDGLTEGGARVTGVKLDVEDSEADVLEGARRLLLGYRPLVYCELWLTPNRDRAVSLMRGLDYDVLVHQKGALEPFVPHLHASAQDFFFVPRTSS